MHKSAISYIQQLLASIARLGINIRLFPCKPLDSNWLFVSFPVYLPYLDTEVASAAMEKIKMAHAMAVQIKQLGKSRIDQLRLHEYCLVISIIKLHKHHANPYCIRAIFPYFNGFGGGISKSIWPFNAFICRDKCIHRGCVDKNCNLLHRAYHKALLYAAVRLSLHIRRPRSDPCIDFRVAF